MSVGARLAHERVQVSKVLSLVCCAWAKLKVVSWCTGPLELWRLASKSLTLWFCVERRWRICAGDVETPSFMEKLLIGKRDQGDRKLGMSLGSPSFVATQGVPKRDSVAEKRYSRLSATMWTRGGLVHTDTTGYIFMSRVWFLLCPLYIFAFNSCNLCAFTFLVHIKLGLDIGCKTFLGRGFHTRRILVVHLDSIF